MQTERVTFLTSADHKASLDAFAAARKQSVGHVLREASAQYMSKPTSTDDYEEALALLLPELEALLPKWNAQLDDMEQSIAEARRAVREAIQSVEAGK
uniref:hypothetical protein n=1 Tax=uncultured Sphingomonas sp. TaxID=158754 RepID=UPI0025DD21EA|nr:hypothetical protein [uncultured Sphingomonas sp.]